MLAADPMNSRVVDRPNLYARPMSDDDTPARAAIETSAAPAALGPYSQAIVAGGFVFCSGTAGIDPRTGDVAEGIEAQTEQALLNLASILEAAGASLADLVKTTIFYADVDDFAKLKRRLRALHA